MFEDIIVPEFKIILTEFGRSYPRFYGTWIKPDGKTDIVEQYQRHETYLTQYAENSFKVMHKGWIKTGTDAQYGSKDINVELGRPTQKSLKSLIHYLEQESLSEWNFYISIYDYYDIKTHKMFDKTKNIYSWISHNTNIITG
jgi:hypothetical protein